MTTEEIQDYKNNIGKRIGLLGLTSCSLNESTASHFMWENKESGHIKVLLHIHWGESKHCTRLHYFLNAGSYDAEEEVLL